MRSQRVRHDLATKKTKTRFIFLTVEVKENRKAFKRKIRIYFNPTIQLRSLWELYMTTLFVYSRFILNLPSFN